MFILFLFLLISPLQLVSENISNVLISTDPVQISSSINVYENLVVGKPAQGTVMITHDAKALIDKNSFRLGEKPLKVEFVESSPMSQFSNLKVTIYQFNLEGLPAGSQTLPPIRIKVDGKVYQAPPMTVQVSG